MKFNNNYISVNKKNMLVQILAILVIIIIGFCLWLLIIPFAINYINDMNISEVIASITLFILISKIVTMLACSILKNNMQSKRKISLDTNVHLDYVIITCNVENCGKKRIIPQNIYMMIEEGEMVDSIANFPYILKHEEGEYDCVFAKFCKNGGITSMPEHIIPEEYKNKYRKVLKLKYLSSETIMFIDPGEEFSEDVIVKLNKGVYKITVVWTSVKEDCICCTKEFVIT